MRWAPLVAAALILVACSTSHKPAGTGSSDTTSTSVPAESIGANRGDPMAPVRLLQRVAGSKLDDKMGRKGVQDDAWIAGGHWGYSFWSTGPNGEWGEDLQVWYYQDHAGLAAAVPDVTPQAHRAVIVGDVWFAELDAGSADHLGVDGPTPQVAAAAMGGTVAKVWP
jgi:hypothetical protein